MAQKIIPAGPKPTAKERGWLPYAMLATAILGGAVAYFWPQAGGSLATRSSLPALPDVAGRPAELGRLLQDAQARMLAEHGSADSVATLGRIYHSNGFLGEARACWMHLHATQPREARWCYYLSDLSLLAADEAGVRAWLEETVRFDPNYAPAWLQLAELEFKNGQLEPARRAYLERERLVPGGPHASLGLARLALQQDRTAEGKRLLEDLIKRVPEFPSSHNYYAEILAQEGDTRGAAKERWLGSMAGRFRVPDDPWMEELRPWCCDVNQLVVWGAIDLQTKHGDRGRAFFEKAVRIDPRDPQGFENLGAFFLGSGNPARAAEILEQGSLLPHASELLFSYLGDAYLALHQPAKAQAVAERGLALMPGSSRFHNLIGLALAATNRPEEAMVAYRKAIACSSGSAEPVANLGLVLLQQGRREEAIAALKQALELQPGYDKAGVPLAHLQLNAGDLPAAAAYIFPYFQQFPALPEARALMSHYYLTSALAAARKNDPAGIEQACRTGLGFVPESSELNGFLGMTYRQLGRTDEALKALETSYQLKPGDSRVALGLADLYIQLQHDDDARRILDAAASTARQRGNADVLRQVTEMQRRLH